MEEHIKMEAIKNFGSKIGGFFSKVFGGIKKWFKNVNWKVVYERFTTGLLIFLMSSPFLILLYILLWFVFK